MGGVTHREDLLDREGACQRHDRFNQQTFWEQSVTGFGRQLNVLVRDMRFRPLHSADEERWLALVCAQRKGQLGQHRVLVVAKSEGRFPFFVQKRIRAQANAKLLFLFAR